MRRMGEFEPVTGKILTERTVGRPGQEKNESGRHHVMGEARQCRLGAEHAATEPLLALQEQYPRARFGQHRWPRAR